MNPARYHAHVLAGFLTRHKIATLTELKEALGTEVDSTVFLKLKELVYRTSYSHRGRYYTLDEVARFDDLGLSPCVRIDVATSPHSSRGG